MMIYTLIDKHPWAFVFFSLLPLYLIGVIICWPFRLINRVIRHYNIKAKGWPPVHLDADGDYSFSKKRGN